MKHLGLLLLGSITVFVGFFRLWPNQETPQPPVVISVQSELDPLKTSLAQQEAEYLIQLEELTQSLQTRQDNYQTQARELNNQIIATQDELNDLHRDHIELQLKLKQLETTRIEQTASYQVQLQDAQIQYDQYLPQLQAQLEETRLELNQVKLQLQGQ